MHFPLGAVGTGALELWPAIFAAALVLLIAGVLASTLAGRRGRQVTLAVIAPFSLLLALVIAADYSQVWLQAASPVVATLLCAAALAAGIVASLAWRHHTASSFGTRAADGSRAVGSRLWPIAVVLVMNFAGAALAAHRCVNNPPTALNSEARPFPGTFAMQRVEDAYALTDRGRPVEVFMSPSDASDGPPLMASPLTWYRVIETQGADRRSNCHGFVFTGGRYLLDCNGVALVLADNGYQQIPQPTAGDLAVYRDRAGQIIHTGVVKFTDDQGLVLVESKLGIESAFLHRPADAWFGGCSITYHRSERLGHLLAIMERPPLAQSGHDESEYSTSPGPEL